GHVNFNRRLLRLGGGRGQRRGGALLKRLPVRSEEPGGCARPPVPHLRTAGRRPSAERGAYPLDGNLVRVDRQPDHLLGRSDPERDKVTAELVVHPHGIQAGWKSLGALARFSSHGRFASSSLTGGAA